MLYKIMTISIQQLPPPHTNSGHEPKDSWFQTFSNKITLVECGVLVAAHDIVRVVVEECKGITFSAVCIFEDGAFRNHATIFQSTTPRKRIKHTAPQYLS
jgi:hypothetical protein